MDLELWQILVLAVVQGVTEFLPVSSSGHLVVLASLMSQGEESSLRISDLNIVVHVGTLLSILVFYWRRVWRLLGEDRRTVALLFVGTLPVVAFGVPLKLYFDEVLENALLAGCLLVFTGAMLFWAGRLRWRTGNYRDLSLRHSLLIGLSQAVAILPGVSRSGATISAGLSLGLSPQSAATFSFLLAIPAIAGAGLLEIVHLSSSASGTTPWPSLALAAAISFGVGLLSLWWLVRLLERGRLAWFALWCVPLGAAVVVYELLA